VCLAEGGHDVFEGGIAGHARALVVHREDKPLARGQSMVARTIACRAGRPTARSDSATRNF